MLNNNRTDSSYLCLLGLLNSKLFDFLYNLFSGDKQLFKRIILENIKSLPFPERTFKIYAPHISPLAKKRWESNVSEKDAIDLEIKIDCYVYHMFDLNFDDILIIDPNTSITSDMYNKFKI